MSDARLRELYALGVAGCRSADRTACPPPERVQALARREGAEEIRLATLDHVMGCADCRAELDLLRGVEVAGGELAETGTGRRAGRRWYLPAALAATVLLAVGIGRVATTAPGEDEIVRGGDAGIAAVGLLLPPTAAAAGTSLVFAWRPVPDARRYRLEVLNRDGQVVVEAETADTLASPAEAGRLPAGAYQWWVTALLPASERVSELRALRLTAK